MASNGIINQNGIMWLAAAPLYLALVPVTSAITGENSVVQKAMETALALIPGSSNIAKDRVIPALSALYIFCTFAASGAASVAAQAMSRKDGLDNNHPRSHQSNMFGLPLRLRSAHLNMMENFPAFALAAALTQASAPTNQRLINLLGYHVLAKGIFFLPAYVADVAPLRSLLHLSATASIINVTWQIATGAK